MLRGWFGKIQEHANESCVVRSLVYGIGMGVYPMKMMNSLFLEHRKKE